MKMIKLRVKQSFNIEILDNLPGGSFLILSNDLLLISLDEFNDNGSLLLSHYNVIDIVVI